MVQDSFGDLEPHPKPLQPGRERPSQIVQRPMRHRAADLLFKRLPDPPYGFAEPARAHVPIAASRQQLLAFLVLEQLLDDRERCGRQRDEVRNDFKGKLSYSWPKRADQTPLNRGDRNYDPLFAYDHGLTYASAGNLPRLSEERPAGVAAGADGVIFGRGRSPAGWSLDIAQEGGPTVVVTGPTGATGENRVRVSGVDRRAQEDSRLFAFDDSGVGIARIGAPQPLDLTREANGELHLIVEYRVDEAPTGEVLLGMNDATVPITGFIRAAPPGQWTSLSVPLQCFGRGGADFQRITAPFVLRTGGRLRMAVSDIRLAHPGGSLSMQCGRP